MSSVALTEKQIEELILLETKGLLEESNSGVLSALGQSLSDNRLTIQLFLQAATVTGFTKRFLGAGGDDALFLGMATWNLREGDYIAAFFDILSASKGLGSFITAGRLVFRTGAGLGKGGKNLKAAGKTFPVALKTIVAARQTLNREARSELTRIRKFKELFEDNEVAKRQLKYIDDYYKNLVRKGDQLGAAAEGAEIGIKSLDDFLAAGMKMSRIVDGQYRSLMHRVIFPTIRIMTMVALAIEASLEKDIETLRTLKPGASDEELEAMAERISNVNLDEMYTFVNKCVGDGLGTAGFSIQELTTQLLRFVGLTLPTTPYKEDLVLRKRLLSLSNPPEGAENAFSARIGIAPTQRNRTFQELSELFGYGKDLKGVTRLARDLEIPTEPREDFNLGIQKYMEEGRETGYFIPPKKRGGSMNENKLVTLTEEQINKLILQETQALLTESVVRKIIDAIRQRAKERAARFAGKVLSEDDVVGHFNTLKAAIAKGEDISEGTYATLHKQLRDADAQGQKAATGALKKLKIYEEAVGDVFREAAKQGKLLDIDMLDAAAKEVKSNASKKSRDAIDELVKRVKEAPEGTSQVPMRVEAEVAQELAEMADDMGPNVAAYPLIHGWQRLKRGAKRAAYTTATLAGVLVVVKVGSGAYTVWKTTDEEIEQDIKDQFLHEPPLLSRWRKFERDDDRTTGKGSGPHYAMFSRFAESDEETILGTQAKVFRGDPKYLNHVYEYKGEGDWKDLGTQEESDTDVPDAATRP